MPFGVRNKKLTLFYLFTR